MTSKKEEPRISLDSAVDLANQVHFHTKELNALLDKCAKGGLVVKIYTNEYARKGNRIKVDISKPL